MTLIIGIKCADGIVIAADGAATLGNIGSQTLRQPVKKLSILHGKVVVGVSGPVGLGQKIVQGVDDLYGENKLSGKNNCDAMKVFSESLREQIRPEFEMTQVSSKVLGNTAVNSVLSSTIIALPIKREACLIQFDYQGSSEQATEDLPFISIGSGEPIADPFLGFIRRIFWKDGIPETNGGIFAALWTLRHAISLHPGGVADPIQIVVLKKDGADWTAKELQASELEEHEEAIQAAEEKLATFREELVDVEKAQPVPDPEKTKEKVK
ncbi:MAG: Ntn hydrolase family protein [Thermoleophilia bacterium]